MQVFSLLYFDGGNSITELTLKESICSKFEKEIPSFSMIHPAYLGENRGSFHVDKLNCKHFFLMNDTRHS